MRRPSLPGCVPTLLTALLVGLPHALAAEDRPRYERRWVYSMTNLQVKENADRLIELIGRARHAGFNGLVLADYKLNILDRVPDHYAVNVRRVQAAADAAGVEIIPAIFPIGYSNGLLAHDPNLAEGLPVVRAPFVVRDGQVVAAFDPGPLLKNGDLEDARGDTFTGYAFQDGPGSSTFVDTRVVHQGQRALRIEVGQGEGPNRRITQRVALRPHTAYRFSAWVKTEGLDHAESFRLLALGAGPGKQGQALTFFEGGVAATQDWRRVDVVFNSLEHAAATLYVGVWGSGRGRLWIDQIACEPLGLVNVLRRPGCPLTVESEDGATTYVEGKDFEPVRDPKLGSVPYLGEFEFDHEPAVIRVAGSSRLREGQRLRVSWYHPVLTHGSQIMCCPSEPKTLDLLRDQARRVTDLLHPRTFFLSHDEIRVLNWCRACRDRSLTPGQILAENVRQCRAILREVQPNAELVIWSDMFDPFHNAVSNYYLVNGTLDGSWLGLDPSITVANWNGGRKRQSLDFFAQRGHRQLLAGYYDTEDLSGFTGWNEAAAHVAGVDGFMYTTWQAKYRLIDAYGRAIEAVRTSQPPLSRRK
ncbi:MAG: hypothetical protein U0794_19110 [Isosphaeraceae bacterium]